MRTLLLLAAILFFFLSLTCFAAAASIDKKNPRKPVAVEDDVPEARERVPAASSVKPPPIQHRPGPGQEPVSESPRHLIVTSTAYCLNENRMANGERPHDGSVAMDGVKFGTQVSVLSGPLAGRTFTVKDRTDGKTQADFWFRSCEEVLVYGRRKVLVKLG